MVKTAKLSRASSAKANRVYEALVDCHVGTLATIGRYGWPYLSVMYFDVEKDFTISFTTKKGTKKYQNLLKKSHVELLAFDEGRQLSITVSGNAEEVTNKETEAKIIENTYWNAATVDHHAPPVAKLAAGAYVAYQINPRRITMAHFLRRSKDTHNIFETLNFER